MSWLPALFPSRYLNTSSWENALYGKAKTLYWHFWISCFAAIKGGIIAPRCNFFQARFYGQFLRFFFSWSNEQCSFTPDMKMTVKNLLKRWRTQCEREKKGFPIESELSTRAKWTLMSSKSEVMMLQISGRDRFPGFDSENGRNSLEDWRNIDIFSGVWGSPELGGGKQWCEGRGELPWDLGEIIREKRPKKATDKDYMSKVRAFRIMPQTSRISFSFDNFWMTRNWKFDSPIHIMMSA